MGSLKNPSNRGNAKGRKRANRKSGPKDGYYETHFISLVIIFRASTVPRFRDQFINPANFKKICGRFSNSFVSREDAKNAKMMGVHVFVFLRALDGFA